MRLILLNYLQTYANISKSILVGILLISVCFLWAIVSSVQDSIIVDILFDGNYTERKYNFETFFSVSQTFNCFIGFVGSTIKLFPIK